MTTQYIINLADEYVLATYARFPVAFTRGEGSTLYDPEGKTYIDFASGIGVNSLGYANTAWVNAVTEQAAKLAHVSNLYYTEPMAKLAEQLTRRTEMSAAFFSNSGAESNEGIIKLARKYSYEKFGSQNRHVILTLQNSFHGRTITTLEATGQEKFHGYDFFPYTGGFKYIQPGNIAAAKAACSEGSVCAVMIELIQGEGGVYPLPKDYVQELAEFCAENEILLLVDEVQTGVGRTGTLFAFQQYGITPDAVSFAKGIGGGLPLGGFLVNEKVRGVLRSGDHATTFGGNPICCAGALAVLETLTDTELSEVTRKGEKIRQTVLSWNSPNIAEVRGLGLMIGIKLTGVSHRDTVVKLLDSGVVALTAGSDTLRLLPPLTITDTELEQGLDVIRQVLQ
ncbi:MAG: acetylornithine/succinylornithine family transaminase [Oscillospiraceae bacterium]|jgi:acetylornithine/N-succinyldiaminopimelate aminotransferase|nr:acetylornithine/succinylornithine family transaminase [Oscillospiraceae bacterium]